MRSDYGRWEAESTDILFSTPARQSPILKDTLACSHFGSSNIPSSIPDSSFRSSRSFTIDSPNIPYPRFKRVFFLFLYPVHIVQNKEICQTESSLRHLQLCRASAIAFSPTSSSPLSPPSSRVFGFLSASPINRSLILC